MIQRFSERALWDDDAPPHMVLLKSERHSVFAEEAIAWLEENGVGYYSMSMPRELNDDWREDSILTARLLFSDENTAFAFKMMFAGTR